MYQFVLLLSALLSAGVVSAQIPSPAPATQPAQIVGTLVIVPAQGEVRLANDEARATFMIEEQDKEKAVAASRVNQKMKQGMEIIRKEDPQATLRTRGYFTYPVYPEDQPRLSSQGSQGRKPVRWRVGQYLEITTVNLNNLPKTVTAAQQILALTSLQFGLSDAARKQADEKRIEAAYKNLTERLAAIARAMGRNPSDAVIDTVDFEASGAYLLKQDAAPAMMRSVVQEMAPVEEPSFEPGDTTLEMRVVGKVRFR